MGHGLPDAFAAHGAEIPALLKQTVSEPAILVQDNSLAEVLEKAGFAPDAIVVAVTMLDRLCIGAALDLAAPSVVWAVDDRDSAVHRALTEAGPELKLNRQDRAFELHFASSSKGCQVNWPRTHHPVQRATADQRPTLTPRNTNAHTDLTAEQSPARRRRR
jgi:hypothetical protein